MHLERRKGAAAASELGVMSRPVITARRARARPPACSAALARASRPRAVLASLTNADPASDPSPLQALVADGIAPGVQLSKMLADILAEGTGLTSLDLSKNNMARRCGACACCVLPPLAPPPNLRPRRRQNACAGSPGPPPPSHPCNPPAPPCTHPLPQDDAAVAGVMDALRGNELMAIQAGGRARRAWCMGQGVPMCNARACSS